MSKENDYEMSPINPGWIKKNKVPARYADDDLKRIIMFYVINTPCEDKSSSSISLSQYGWDKKVWRKDTLKNALFKVANLKRGETFFTAANIPDIKDICEKANLKKNFHSNRGIERIAIYKGKYPEFMSVFGHIRNSLAHGRLAMYDCDENDVMFVLEDGVKKYGKFQVRSRMVLKKSTLLKWIDIIEKGNLD